MEHTEHPSHNSMNNFASAILWVLTGVFNILAGATIESVYTWVFRLLSLVSVIMVIIINWPKVRNILFKKKK